MTHDNDCVAVAVSGNIIWRYYLATLVVSQAAFRLEAHSGNGFVNITTHPSASIMGVYGCIMLFMLSRPYGDCLAGQALAGQARGAIASLTIITLKLAPYCAMSLVPNRGGLELVKINNLVTK
jgi:hypothetical protein